MRIPFLFRILAALVCYGSGIISARASHVQGAELTYEYVGTAANPDLYHVSARLFRDYTSTVDQPMVELTCGRNECRNTLPGSFTYTMMRTSSTRVTGCASANSHYAVDVFDGVVTLAPARWTLSLTLTNRQFGIANMAASDMQALFVKAELDHTNNLVNSSPRFTTARLIELTNNQPQRYSMGAFDSEGDSLVYQLVQPLSEPVATAPCGQLTSGAIAPHFQLDAASGELLTVAGPIQQGIYAMAVRVTEYRRLGGTWQAIGSITRDANYLVTAGTNQPPAFTRVARAGSPNGQLLGQTIPVNPGQSLSLLLTAADPDAGQTLTLSSSVGAIVPGASFQDQGNGQGQLTWLVPSSLPLGRYTLTATSMDNACPVVGASVLTLSLLVTQQVLATRPRQQLTQLPFPVPFQDEVRFQLAGNGQQAIIIVDGLGRIVARLTSAADGSAVWRPVAAVSAGLYFARNLAGTQVARLQYSGH